MKQMYVSTKEMTVKVTTKCENIILHHGNIIAMLRENFLRGNAVYFSNYSITYIIPIFPKFCVQISDFPLNSLILSQILILTN